MISPLPRELYSTQISFVIGAGWQTPQEVPARRGIHAMRQCDVVLQAPLPLDTVLCKTVQRCRHCDFRVSVSASRLHRSRNGTSSRSWHFTWWPHRHVSHIASRPPADRLAITSQSAGRGRSPQLCDLLPQAALLNADVGCRSRTPERRWSS